ncbi:MAG TPA: hypothetical protein QF433_00950, partial [Candidatus Thalassarchaeaceae archaeon]|nr:hypothetical protein [Candidatus Thalassarchaeaceae archaeon]
AFHFIFLQVSATTFSTFCIHCITHFFISFFYWLEISPLAVHSSYPFLTSMLFCSSVDFYLPSDVG